MLQPKQVSNKPKKVSRQWRTIIGLRYNIEISSNDLVGIRTETPYSVENRPPKKSSICSPVLASDSNESHCDIGSALYTAPAI